MEPLLTQEEVADLFQIAARTLENWRSMSPPRGPRFIKIGRQVRYRTLDVLAYLKEQTVQTIVD